MRGGGEASAAAVRAPRLLHGEHGIDRETKCDLFIILTRKFQEAKKKKNLKTYRNFMLIRLAEGEPQVETRLPCLHQQVTSNALIDGSRKPCHLERRERHTHKIVPPTHSENTRGHGRAPTQHSASSDETPRIWFI